MVLTILHKMKKKKVLFISSTGGHLNELLQLSPLFKKYDYHIITEKDETTKGLKEKYGDIYHIYHMEQEKRYLDMFLFIFIYA